MMTKPNMTFCLTVAFLITGGGLSRAQRPSSTNEEPLQYRTWTDSAGKYQTEAAMVDYQDGAVHLRKKHGKTAIAPLGRLSREDQRYLREELARRRAREKESRPGPDRPTTPGAGAEWPGRRGPQRDGRLPEGNAGIAAKYPGDKGIDKDPAVLFADDFERSLSVADLRKRWEVLTNKANLSIAAGAGQKHGGEKSLLMTLPRQNAPLATGVAKLLTDTQDILFLRWYMKFDGGWSVPGGSVHNGASISSKYFDRGRATPGIRADGRNKFLVSFENENSTGDAPGHMNVYIYWPEQGDKWGDHFFPSGTVLPFSVKRSGAATFGKQFEARPDFSPQTDRWYCYEYMVKANTPGKRDGRIALWVDGRLIADFPNLRLRDVDDLEIDRFGLGLYIANNRNRANRKWHDDVVAATSYIGPMASSE